MNANHVFVYLNAFEESEWADYCCSYAGKMCEPTGERVHTQLVKERSSSQLAKPLSTDPDQESGTGVQKLISA